MALRSEENLFCPVCFNIFQDPVILSCSHSFCKTCLDRGSTAIKCPICKRRSSQTDPPPENLALRNLCEAFIRERNERLLKGSADLCRLHSKKLRLFCLDHQTAVCLVCQHSGTHWNHNLKPIDEAARDYKSGIQNLLERLRRKQKRFLDAQEDFDLKAKDIEGQVQHMERQIKDVFSMLYTFLQKEEQSRMAALRDDQQQRTQMMKRKREALSSEIDALSDTIRATEKQLRADDVSFLQNYRATAERVQNTLPSVTDLTPAAPIDMFKHLNNLPFAVLNRKEEKIFPTHSQRGDRSRRPHSVAVPDSETQRFGPALHKQLFLPPTRPGLAQSADGTDAPDRAPHKGRGLDLTSGSAAAPPRIHKDRRKTELKCPPKTK